MNEVDCGKGVTYRTVTCSHMGKESSGAIVSFHDQDPPCEGLITWCEDCAKQPGNYDKEPWQLHSLHPLHVEPSIQCETHPHHHGFIRLDKWEAA